MPTSSELDFQCDVSDMYDYLKMECTQTKLGIQMDTVKFNTIELCNFWSTDFGPEFWTPSMAEWHDPLAIPRSWLSLGISRARRICPRNSTERQQKHKNKNSKSFKWFNGSFTVVNLQLKETCRAVQEFAVEEAAQRTWHCQSYWSLYITCSCIYNNACMHKYIYIYIYRYTSMLSSLFDHVFIESHLSNLFGMVKWLSSKT